MKTKGSRDRSTQNVVQSIKDLMPMPTKPPTELKAAGKKLWKWIDENFETAGVEPLAFELCALADRLAAIRKELRTSPKIDVRLINAEMKVAAAYARAWKILGLSADDKPKGRAGYPEGVARPERRAG
jgi:hypothetical protein